MPSHVTDRVHAAGQLEDQRDGDDRRRQVEDQVGRRQPPAIDVGAERRRGWR